MSTEYNILTSSSGSVLSLNEGSCEFDLCVDNADGSSQYGILRRLTTNQLAELIVNATQVLSYFDEELAQTVGQTILDGPDQCGAELLKRIDFKSQVEEDSRYAVSAVNAGGELVHYEGPYISKGQLESMARRATHFVWEVPSSDQLFSYYLTKLSKDGNPEIVGWCS